MINESRRIPDNALIRIPSNIVDLSTPSFLQDKCISITTILLIPLIGAITDHVEQPGSVFDDLGKDACVMLHW